MTIFESANTGLFISSIEKGDICYKESTVSFKLIQTENET